MRWMQLVPSARGPAAQGPKKLVIRRNAQHADRSPLPLKLRCLKAVDEYHSRFKVQKEAQLRRNQVRLFGFELLVSFEHIRLHALLFLTPAFGR